MYIDLFTMLEILYQKSKSKVHPFRNFNEILLSVIYSCPDQDKDVRKNLNLLVNERGNWSTKWNNRGDNLLNTLNKCKNCNTMHLGGSSWWHSCRSVVHFEPKKFDRVNSGGQGRSKYGPKLPLYCPLLLPILTFPDPPVDPSTMTHMHQYNLDMHQYNLHHLHQRRYGAAFGHREPLRDGPQTELSILW